MKKNRNALVFILSIAMIIGVVPYSYANTQQKWVNELGESNHTEKDIHNWLVRYGYISAKEIADYEQQRNSFSLDERWIKWEDARKSILSYRIYNPNTSQGRELEAYKNNPQTMKNHKEYKWEYDRFIKEGYTHALAEEAVMNKILQMITNGFVNNYGDSVVYKWLSQAEVFEVKFGRNPTLKEIQWMSSGDTNSYAGYSGVIGREITTSEIQLISSDKGYQIFGITDKEYKDYTNFRELEYKISVARNNDFGRAIAVYTSNNWILNGRETSVYKEVKKNFGIDVFDKISQENRISYSRRASYGGAVDFSTVYDIIQKELKIGKFASNETTRVSYVMHMGKPHKKIQTINKYGSVIGTRLEVVSEEEYKAGILNQNSTPQPTTKPAQPTTHIVYKPTTDLSPTPQNSIVNGIQVQINGKYLQMDVKPIIENSRTLVPLRAIFEALEASIEWDGITQTITATKDNTVIILQIGNKVARINGETVTLDVPAKIVNSRTLVPARFVAESLGAKVDWDNDTRTVIIN